MNTTLLALLAEAVENKRWHEIFKERVWAKMTVEGDMPVAYAPDGTALVHGLVASRLRDMARYGLLYTPSWGKAARERVVSAAFVREIQTGGRKDIFMKGEIGAAMQKVHFPNDPPIAHHWQWDGVWDDGDFFKGGVFGQGLYVSPARDLVAVWFSTAMTSDLTQYARRIALDTPPARWSGRRPSPTGRAPRRPRACPRRRGGRAPRRGAGRGRRRPLDTRRAHRQLGRRPFEARRPGIGLDLDFAGFGVGFLSGTGEEAFEASGRGDAFLTFDAGKLGLWKGGRLSTHFEYRGGELPPSGGALWPASTGTFLPLEARDELVMSTFQLSQTLGRATLIARQDQRRRPARRRPLLRRLGNEAVHERRPGGAAERAAAPRDHGGHRDVHRPTLVADGDGLRPERPHPGLLPRGPLRRRHEPVPGRGLVGRVAGARAASP